MALNINSLLIYLQNLLFILITFSGECNKLLNESVCALCIFLLLLILIHLLVCCPNYYNLYYLEN